MCWWLPKVLKLQWIMGRTRTGAESLLYININCTIRFKSLHKSSMLSFLWIDIKGSFEETWHLMFLFIDTISTKQFDVFLSFSFFALDGAVNRQPRFFWPLRTSDVWSSWMTKNKQKKKKPCGGNSWRWIKDGWRSRVFRTRSYFQLYGTSYS